MKWAHLLCAMWIPEVSLANTTFQEPVQDVEKVPKTRWKLVRVLPQMFTDFANLDLDMLHLQAENGCMYPMRPQILLRGVPCDMRSQSATMPENEVFVFTEPTRRQRLKGLL